MGFGYGDSNRNAGGLRWLIALIVLVGGLVTYLRNVQVNPVTGEKQHVSMTVDQEKSLGLAAAPRMAAQMGGALDPARDRRAAKVAEIGRKLVEHSDASLSPYRDNFHFQLLADPRTVNAFALPGGQVFITAGLYDRLENEAQLAGVLGHETGHVIARHSAQHLAKQQLGQSVSTAVGVARGNRDWAIAQIVDELVQLKYSREDELQSDSFGLKYSAQAGYDPSAMPRVMQILKQAAGSGHGPGIFATHPDPDARIEQIKRHLASEYPNGIPAKLTKGANLRQGALQRTTSAVDVR